MINRPIELYKHLNKNLISLAELSKRWTLDRKTVRRILEKAGIKAFILCGKRNGSIRYSEVEIESFLKMARGEIKPQE